MQKLTKVFSFFMIFALTIISIFSVVQHPLNVQAYSGSAYYDADTQFIVVMTGDKKKTAPVYYHTEHFTVTRCPNPCNTSAREIHPTNEYVTENIASNASVEGGGSQYNSFGIKMANILSDTARYPDWQAEIKAAMDGTGPAVYLKLDSVMRVYKQNPKTGVIYWYSGLYWNAPGMFGGNGRRNTGINSRGDEIHDYGWTNPDGTLTHFNQYVIIGKKTPPVAPTTIDDELVTKDYTVPRNHYSHTMIEDKNEPYFAMGNENGSKSSQDFDIGNGIPSGEYIKNLFKCDSWYGNTDVYARTVSHNYGDYHIIYNWKVPYTEKGFRDDNGNNIQDDGEPDTIKTGYNLKSKDCILHLGTAYVAFQYLRNTSIYDLTNGDVHNLSLGGNVPYDDDIDTYIVCKLSQIASGGYKRVPTSGSTYAKGTDITNWQNRIADTNNHVIWGEINYLPSRNIDNESDSEAVIEEAIKEDTEVLQQRISNATKTQNDILAIKGREYMVAMSDIAGCNFDNTTVASLKLQGSPTKNYRACTNSAAWKNDYLRQGKYKRGPMHDDIAYDPEDYENETENIQIPDDIDNGLYSTDIKVYYQQLLPYTRGNNTISGQCHGSNPEGTRY